MREGIKLDKVPTNDCDNAFNLRNITLENETIRILDALSKKIRPEPEEEICTLKDTCYVGKTKMGSCPCEFYR
jgi:hypothetical protein